MWEIINGWHLGNLNVHSRQRAGAQENDHLVCVWHHSCRGKNNTECKSLRFLNGGGDGVEETGVTPSTVTMLVPGEGEGWLARDA